MKLRYLLDTTICIHIAKQHPMSVLEKFQTLEAGEVGMSIITYGKILFGVQKGGHAKKSQSILEQLTSFIFPLPLPASAAKHYGDLRCKLERQGKPMGNNDLWIAAHALVSELILVSNNVKEFSRVPHLKIDNWVG